MVKGHIMGRKITILGMGLTGQVSRWKPEVFDGTEVWGMNDGMICHPRVKFDRWFEIHAAKYLEQWPNAKRFGGAVGYCQRIDAMHLPVYTLDTLPSIENQVPYPHLEIATHFGINHVDGTPSRMLALACYEHKELGLDVDYIQSFGIDMQDPQHIPQQAAWAMWLGIAHALGIEIGGTAWDFACKPESDTGVAVDRMETGQLMKIEAAKAKDGDGVKTEE
jgi:hypothetical protein